MDIPFSADIAVKYKNYLNSHKHVPLKKYQTKNRSSSNKRKSLCAQLFNQIYRLFYVPPLNIFKYKLHKSKAITINISCHLNINVIS